MSEDQILDLPIGGNEDAKLQVMANLASGGKRFANYLIDIISFYIIFFVIAIVIGVLFPNASNAEDFVFSIFGYLGFVLYYWAFESLTGKTIGKYITRTKIVKEDGSQPETINILGRSFSRLIPFDAFSYLGENGRGWHDRIPKIYVIND